MIDFTNCETRKKSYSGANGNKISIIYNEELYMLKFPSHATKNENLSYSNSVISEYIGSHIFNIAGIPAQETLLGTYAINGQEKIVVACKDFTKPGVILQDFGSIKNQIIESERNGYGTDLDDILQSIDEQQLIDRCAVAERFWDMFIVDAMIGNWDRHNGNWGFLYNQHDDTLELAPVFDCGSSLFAQSDSALKEEILKNKGELHTRVFNRPTSAIRLDGKKINYFDFISSRENEECNKALERIVPRLDMQKINDMIENIPCINEIDKSFYKAILRERKEQILDYTYSLIQKEKEPPTLTCRMQQAKAVSQELSHQIEDKNISRDDVSR